MRPNQKAGLPVSTPGGGPRGGHNRQHGGDEDLSGQYLAGGAFAESHGCGAGQYPNYASGDRNRQQGRKRRGRSFLELSELGIKPWLLRDLLQQDDQTKEIASLGLETRRRIRNPFHPSGWVHTRFSLENQSRQHATHL